MRPFVPPLLPGVKEPRSRVTLSSTSGPPSPPSARVPKRKGTLDPGELPRRGRASWEGPIRAPAFMPLPPPRSVGPPGYPRKGGPQDPCPHADGGVFPPCPLSPGKPKISSGLHPISSHLHRREGKPEALNHPSRWRRTQVGGESGRGQSVESPPRARGGARILQSRLNRCVVVEGGTHLPGGRPRAGGPTSCARPPDKTDVGRPTAAASARNGGHPGHQIPSQQEFRQGG